MASSYTPLNDALDHWSAENENQDKLSCPVFLSSSCSRHHLSAYDFQQQQKCGDVQWLPEAGRLCDPLSSFWDTSSWFDWLKSFLEPSGTRRTRAAIYPRDSHCLASCGVPESEKKERQFFCTLNVRMYCFFSLSHLSRHDNNIKLLDNRFKRHLVRIGGSSDVNTFKLGKVVADGAMVLDGQKDSMNHKYDRLFLPSFSVFRLCVAA